MHVTGQDQRIGIKTLILIVSGNVLEWYDFAVYGYFVSLIAEKFFPSGNRVAALLAAFGVFAIGFVGRIGGGLFYGIISDRRGRSYALRLSVILMASATTLMGLLPAYRTIGAAAPLLLTMLRIAQGLSVGGEFTTSLTLIAERVQRSNVGFASGLVGAAAALGFVLGSGIGYLVTALIGQSATNAWGWRIPFLFGSALGVFAWLMRRNLEHFTVGEGEERPRPTQELIRRVLSSERSAVLRTIAGMSLYMVAFYLPFVYLGAYLESRDFLSMRASLALTTASLLLLTFLTPAAGWLADRVGVKSTLYVSGITLGLFTPLMLFLVDRSSIFELLVVLAIFAVLNAPFMAVAALPCALQFPPDVRGTGFSLGFNIAAVFFGGLCPIAADLIVHITGSLAAAGLLATVTAGLSILGWVGCRGFFPPARLNSPSADDPVGI